MLTSSVVFLLSLLFILVVSTSGHGGHDGGDDDSTPSDESNLTPRKSILMTKIWCLILNFIGTFVGGISPYFFRKKEGFLVLGTQFAGGVFLGTGLMHFLSDSNETFEGLTRVEYTFASMLASAGYLLTMLADCAIYYLYGNQNNSGTGLRYRKGGAMAMGGANSHTQIQVHEIRHAHFVDAQTMAAYSLGDNVVLIIALCFHTVFEGIDIGVTKDAVEAWKALWTISIHKIFAAIAMGIAILRMIPDRPRFTCLAYAFALAISSPIGVLIGIVMDTHTQGEVADWIFAISMGLACGVFVYVSVNHLLAMGYVAREECSLDTPIYKFLAVLGGIGVIAIVMVWDH